MLTPLIDNEEDQITSLTYLKYVYQQLLEKACDDEGIENLRKATAMALKAGIAAKTACAYQNALEYFKVRSSILLIVLIIFVVGMQHAYSKKLGRR